MHIMDAALAVSGLVTAQPPAYGEENLERAKQRQVRVVLARLRRVIVPSTRIGFSSWRCRSRVVGKGRTLAETGLILIERC